jgi:hypothetical protein
MVDRSRVCPECDSPKAFPATLYDGFEVGVYCHACETFVPADGVAVSDGDPGG